MLDTEEQRKGVFFACTLSLKNVVFRTNVSILGEELGA